MWRPFGNDPGVICTTKIIRSIDKLTDREVKKAEIGGITFNPIPEILRRVSLPHHSYLGLKTLLAEPPVEEKKEDPFLNIAPKKPNWDLRRDLQKELDKLVKRTQKALYQLMASQTDHRCCLPLPSHPAHQLLSRLPRICHGY
nr:hypothetical protein [Tanacetum cinerariifolium]